MGGGGAGFIALSVTTICECGNYINLQNLQPATLGGGAVSSACQTRAEITCCHHVVIRFSYLFYLFIFLKCEIQAVSASRGQQRGGCYFPYVIGVGCTLTQLAAREAHFIQTVSKCSYYLSPLWVLGGWQEGRGLGDGFFFHHLLKGDSTGLIPALKPTHAISLFCYAQCRFQTGCHAELSQWTFSWGK